MLFRPNAILWKVKVLNKHYQINLENALKKEDEKIYAETPKNWKSKVPVNVLQ